MDNLSDKLGKKVFPGTILFAEGFPTCLIQCVEINGDVGTFEFGYWSCGQWIASIKDKFRITDQDLLDTNWLVDERY